MKTLGATSKVSPLKLSLLDARLAVCRLSPETQVPAWASGGDLFSVTRTPDELSVICPEDRVPPGISHQGGWRALKIRGPLEFSSVGVLLSVAAPLADAGVSIFAVSTFDTDYVLVKEERLDRAVAALHDVGHKVRDGPLDVAVRAATPNDESFLWEMLYEAVHWGPGEQGPKPPPEALLSEPRLARYLTGWGRDGDLAVVATGPDGERRIGAAWCRLFREDERGYGFVDERTPELAIAVSDGHRGEGVGGTLLTALAGAAKDSGFDALSLSVQRSNRAAAKLYEKEGFVDIKDDGKDRVMKLDL